MAQEGFERLPYVIERQVDGMGGDTELSHVIQADEGKHVQVFSLPFVEPPVPVTGAWLTWYVDLLERVADKLVQDVRGYLRVGYCVELGGAPRQIRVTWSGRKR